jgi:hypothetical protein
MTLRVRSEYLELRKTLPDVSGANANRNIVKVYRRCKRAVPTGAANIRLPGVTATRKRMLAMRKGHGF